MLKIIQITDMHLFAEDTATLSGIPTNQTFDAILQQALLSNFKPDYYLLTGDLTQDYQPKTYQKLAQKLSIIQEPIYFIPGNHDAPPVMKEYLKGGPLRSEKTICSKNWKVILLDSAISQIVAGHLSEQECTFLAQNLENTKEEHILIALHHHPMQVGSSWIDKVALTKQEVFWNIIRRSTKVRGILFGHIHQDYESVYQGVRLFATPSTCVQFAPNLDKFTIDSIAPGYRELTLYPDGLIETTVRRLQNDHPTVDLNS